MPSRQPRKPSIGLNSCSASTRARDALGRRRPSRSPAPPGPRRRAAGTRAAAGRACGSSPAGPPSPEDALEVGALERQQLGERRARAPRPSRPGSSRASRSILPWSKNMCSVRHRPMPSAPNATACAPGRAGRRWCGRRACGTSSAHSISCGETADRPATAPASSVLSISTCDDLARLGGDLAARTPRR